LTGRQEAQHQDFSKPKKFLSSDKTSHDLAVLVYIHNKAINYNKTPGVELALYSVKPPFNCDLESLLLTYLLSWGQST